MEIDYSEPLQLKIRHFITFLGHLMRRVPLLKPGIRKASVKAQESDSKAETGFERMSSQTAIWVYILYQVVFALHLSSLGYLWLGFRAQPCMSAQSWWVRLGTCSIGLLPTCLRGTLKAANCSQGNFSQVSEKSEAVKLLMTLTKEKSPRKYP